MKDQFLIHPTTGTICFGDVPYMKSRNFALNAGEIRLQTGTPMSWGASHIWAEHKKEMHHKGLTTYSDVPAYVSLIIQVGTPLLYDFGRMGRNVRLLAVKSSVGMAVLEFKDRSDGPIWSVITAYAKTRADGTRVGTVR
jgi:hypothetical protein